ncbi:unnamed protein product [Vitrella brassicaformis CCMP3155]|uniref:Uncharacterized protein n=1 Tax=Vitrella brassicaformis (strain CCMP3155) TaxID=1169540 RepID=A0A0G4EY87_VITBC|nr:unnamed protein product [Vitrella brassicaformis CCMP3155]|eukprot:CEM04095.1 unnamed protein product [Vitrella brassicaformis CCMP3155]
MHVYVFLFVVLGQFVNANSFVQSIVPPAVPSGGGDVSQFGIDDFIDDSLQDTLIENNGTYHNIRHSPSGAPPDVEDDSVPESEEEELGNATATSFLHARTGLSDRLVFVVEMCRHGARAPYRYFTTSVCLHVPMF